jgi:hypothetical protein
MQSADSKCGEFSEDNGDGRRSSVKVQVLGSLQVLRSLQVLVPIQLLELFQSPALAGILGVIRNMTF